MMMMMTIHYTTINRRQWPAATLRKCSWNRSIKRQTIG
jgi:hypothetical protein